MVSVNHIGEEHGLLKKKLNSSTQACFTGNLEGIKVPLYRFGRQPNNSSSTSGAFSRTKEQSILDTLLLAQWEDRAWKGLLKYDVTACETKIIGGNRKFVAQLNEEWSLNYSELEESKNFWPFDYCNFMKIRREELLFCVASGKKVTSELISVADLPDDANLIIINANPVEYGHVILVPHGQPQKPDMKSLEMARQVAVEVNSPFFHVFYDYSSASTVNHLYFQACYFANPFPVEQTPAVPIFGRWQESGIQICDVADYPVKTLLFMGSGESKALTEIVAKICSCLRDQNSLFNLLISDYGTKIFLFPVVQTSTTGGSLSAWECGGHFVFNTRHDFDQTVEETMLTRLAGISLRDEGFEAVKLLSCDIADKYFS